MENIIIAIISGIVAIVVAGIGVITKSKIIIRNEKRDEQFPPSNAKLTETLNATVEYQNRQIDILREIIDEQQSQLEEKNREIEDLKERVSNLEKLTIAQALTISGLQKAGRSSRRAHHEGGETHNDD